LLEAPATLFELVLAVESPYPKCRCAELVELAIHGYLKGQIGQHQPSSATGVVPRSEAAEPFVPGS